MTDLIIVVVIAAICGAAARYIYRAKKSGAKCIGCSAGEGCCCSHDGNDAGCCCNAETR